MDDNGTNPKGNLSFIDNNIDAALAAAKMAGSNPATHVKGGDFVEKFDYIKQHTGEVNSLDNSQNLINQNYIAAQYNEAKQKSQDQGFFSEAAGFLAQTVGGEIIMGAFSGAGYLLDVQHWGSQLFGGEGDYGNWLSDYMEEGQNWIREVAPIYEDPDNAGRSTWENMLRGDGWWASNGVSIASSLSILIPVAGWAKGVSLAGKAMKAAGSAGRVGKIGQTAVKVTKTVDKVMDKFPMMGDTAKAGLDGIHKATVSRLIESQMEATGVFKDRYEHYLDSGLSDEEARTAAGKAAAFTYNWNWGALLTEIPQYMLLGKSGKTVKKWLHTKKPGFITDSKLLSKTKGLRSVGFTMGSEGIEEGYQFVVSEEGKRMGDIEAGLLEPEDSSFGERLDKYLGEAEMQTSMLFGALGGGAFSAAGPKAGELMNKAFRKGEDNLTLKDLKVQEAKTRYTRIAHNMDNIQKAADTGDAEAIFAAKSNMAFDMARDAVQAGNYEQARSAMAQLKNATSEEKEAYEIKENFGEFIEGIDEWIAHMDKAAEFIDNASTKYTYGLADKVAKLQHSQYMYGVQSPRVKQKLEQATREALPNLDKLSKDGNFAVEQLIEVQGQELALQQMEQIMATQKLAPEVQMIFEEQMTKRKALIKNQKAMIKETSNTEGVLNEYDKLAMETISGGSANEVVSLSAKDKMLDLTNIRDTKELNKWTSRAGRREYKQNRATKAKQEAAKRKVAKDAAKAKAAEEKAVNGTTSDKTATGSSTPIADLDMAEVAAHIESGGKFIDYTTDPNELRELKSKLADWTRVHKENPNIKTEELEEDELAGDGDITFNEETEREEDNILDESGVEGDVDTAETLAKDIENSEAHDLLEIPDNPLTERDWRVGDDVNNAAISVIPAQLAWLSANNPEADPAKITPAMKALASFLEDPGTHITKYDVKFEINQDYINEKQDALYKKMQSDIAKGIIPDITEIGFLPIKATIMENGKPVERQGQELVMNLHDPSFFYNADKTPKYPGVSQALASEVIQHKLAIVKRLMKNEEVTTALEGKSRGKLNVATAGDGGFAKLPVAQTLKTAPAKLKIVVGSKKGGYVTPKKKSRLILGQTATPGAFYVEAKTATGSLFPVRLHISDLSTSEATLIHAIYLDMLNNPLLAKNALSEHIVDFINNSSSPVIKGMTSYLPSIETMTYQELLDHLVYEGSRTKAKKKHKLMAYLDRKDSNGNPLVNSLHFGESNMTAERLASEEGKIEFINWLAANKRRQVDAAMLSKPKYKEYVNNNKILSTNVRATPEGNIFVQPVITYSKNMKTTRPTLTETAEKLDATTKAEVLIGLKADLAAELSMEGGPNQGIVDDLKSQIKALEVKAKPKKVVPSTSQTNEVKLDGATRVDAKGRTVTYFGNTTSKDGVTKTAYTFNRSDKASSQRNKAFVPTDIALGNKYTIPKETKNADGSMSDQIPEGMEVVSVSEIREAEGRAGATVILQDKSDPTIRFEANIVLEINTKPSQTSEVEDKKADIEKRRKAEIDEADRKAKKNSPDGSGITYNKLNSIDKVYDAEIAALEAKPVQPSESKKEYSSFQEEYDEMVEYGKNNPKQKDESVKEFTKGDVTIRISPAPTYMYTKEELKQATGELVEVEIVNTSAPLHKGVSQLIDLSSGETIGTSWRGSGKMFQSGKSTKELIEIILDGLTIQEVIGTDLHTALQAQKTLPTAQQNNKTADTVANTIKMFQKGIKTAKEEQIPINLPESTDFKENPC